MSTESLDGKELEPWHNRGSRIPGCYALVDKPLEPKRALEDQ